MTRGRRQQGRQQGCARSLARAGTTRDEIDGIVFCAHHDTDCEKADATIRTKLKDVKSWTARQVCGGNPRGGEAQREVGSACRYSNRVEYGSCSSRPPAAVPSRPAPPIRCVPEFYCSASLLHCSSGAVAAASAGPARRCGRARARCGEVWMAQGLCARTDHHCLPGCEELLKLRGGLLCCLVRLAAPRQRPTVGGSP